MNIGDFIEFTGQDEDGTYVIRGEVTGVNEDKGYVKLDAEAPYNICAVDLVPDQIKVISKPSDFVSAEVRFRQTKEEKAENNTPTPTKVTVKKAPTTPRNGTKFERVVEVVKANPTLTRKEYIALVVEQVGMTPAGASTYVSNARKLLK